MTVGPSVSISSSAPLPLWSGKAPGAEGETTADVPTLTAYLPAPTRATGAAMVVCPGGGYAMLADHEGHPVAQWLAKLGIVGLVLQYRLGPRYRHPIPLTDAARALRTVRARAAEWRIDPGRIGVLGFSAGGHLAATLCTHFGDGDSQAGDPVERFSSRPDLAVLLYPVITMTEPHAHAGSRLNLLGKNPLPELVNFLSLDKQVTRRTPPTFLFHTVSDAAVPVENSLSYAAGLRKAQVDFELHLYQKGAHGVGLAGHDPVLRTWPAPCRMAGKPPLCQEP